MLAHMHPKRHHHRLPQRINGRVGHLGEALTEEGIQPNRNARERRHRRIVTHAPDRIDSRSGHRLENEAQVLIAVAEGHLVLGEGLRREQSEPVRGIRLQHLHVLPTPLAIGLARGNPPLDVHVAKHGSVVHVHRDELARAQPSTLNDLSRIQVHQPHLRTRDHQLVPGHFVAAGSQAITVCGGAGDHPVGEGEGGRAVPRLGEMGVETIEVADGRLDIRILFPSLRDQHHHRMQRIAPRADQQFHRIVEAG
jgi:hypothetical protein